MCGQKILRFLLLYKNAIVFVFAENENDQNSFSFPIFKPTFLDIENVNWVQICKPNHFL